MNNYSDTETKTTLKVAYPQTTSDKTIWEHAWGFELSIVGQFGTGQFGTKIKKRTIWHRDKKADILAPR